jgi:peptidoglycan/xylan/chitin deacetylase (PgdA/CDA1 family)
MTGSRTRQRVKYALKCCVAYTLYGLGILHVWKRIALRGRAVVLAYHRVLPAAAAANTWSHPAIVVTRGTFERHLRVLSRLFKVVTLAEFEARLESGRRFDSATCLVTFDDGWADTCSEAWPLLRRYGIPAVVFLPVRLIGSGDVFWQERLGHLLFETWKRAVQDSSFHKEATQALRPFGLDAALRFSAGTARESIVELVRSRKRDSAINPPAAIQVLEKLLPADSSQIVPGDSFMGWDDVREMARDGITFGGHGANHRILTLVTPAEANHEVAAAREVLDRELPASATAFSYPNGDWDRSIAEAVSRGGFSLAFSMSAGSVAPGDDRLALKRINIHEDVSRNTPMFLTRLLGIF